MGGVAHLFVASLCHCSDFTSAASITYNACIYYFKTVKHVGLQVNYCIHFGPYIIVVIKI